MAKHKTVACGIRRENRDLIRLASCNCKGLY